MEQYDYFEAVIEDIKEYLKEKSVELTWDNYDELHDEMFVSDQVTGNASGSYTFNRWTAEENLCHNWELVKNACDELGIEEDFGKEAEYWDVIVRCHLLSHCMTAILEAKEDTI